MAKMTDGTLLWNDKSREYLQPWLELYPISAEEVPPKLFKSEEPAYQDVHVLRPPSRPSGNQKCSAFPRNDDRTSYFDGILSTRPRFDDPRVFSDNGPPAKRQFRLRILAPPPLHQTTSLDVLVYLPTRPPSIVPRSRQFSRVRRLETEELFPPPPKLSLINRVNKKVILWSLPSHNRGFDLENHGLIDVTGQTIPAGENANVIRWQQRSHDAHSMAECRLLTRVDTNTPKGRDKLSPPSGQCVLRPFQLKDARACDPFPGSCPTLTRPVTSWHHTQQNRIERTTIARGFLDVTLLRRVQDPLLPPWPPNAQEFRSPRGLWPVRTRLVTVWQHTQQNSSERATITRGFRDDTFSRPIQDPLRPPWPPDAR